MHRAIPESEDGSAVFEQKRRKGWRVFRKHAVGIVLARRTTWADGDQLTLFAEIADDSKGRAASGGSVTAYPIGIVWLDGKEAQVHEFGSTSVHSEHIFPNRFGADGNAREDRTHPTEAQRSRYFRDIVSALEDAERVVVVGPDTVRVEFVQYAEAEAPSLFVRIVHTSQYAKPRHGELLAFARAFM